jgi:phenylpropionate dioxygenase-like ring-hydroxylating dioxygenase large terminal subunit
VKPSRFPFPAYPNGWFCVAYADELAPRAVTALRYFGRDVVLFRGEDGHACVLDAHCPHLGAHLGHGGKVEGGAIRCPFHGWLWSGDGRCLEVPYAKRIPPAAKTNAWPVRERNGFVYVWHHAEARPPDYEIPELPEHGSAEWGDYRRLRWQVASRMYDMGENAVDHVHFKYLHGASGAPSNEQSIADDGSVRNFSRMQMTTPRGPVEGSIASEGHGPGMGVVRVAGVVDTIIVTQSTPIDEEHVDVRFSYLQRRSDDPRVARLGEAMLRDLKRQMEQDIVVLEHKAYWTQPLLVPEDGPIAEYRRRARRAYSGRFWDDGE